MHSVMRADLDFFVHGKNMGFEQLGERNLCEKHVFSAYFIICNLSLEDMMSTVLTKTS